MAYIEDELVEQAIADFDSIKQEIIDNGVDVPYGTDTKEYNKFINQACQAQYNKGYNENPYAAFKDIIQESLNHNPDVACSTFRNTVVDDISLFDLSSLKVFSYIFENCERLTTININTDNAVLFNGGFKGCYNLESVTISSTSKVTSFDSMFSGCVALKSVFTALDLSNTTDIGDMFDSCIALEEIRFVEETIMRSIDIPSSFLSDESIQSIIGGLSSKTGGSLLVLHSDVIDSLTDEQWEAVSNKNWNII